MFGCFFSGEEKITHFDQVMACNVDQFRKYFHVMLDNNVYLAPSAFEAGFVSAAHGQQELDTTMAAAEKAFAAV
jgi:glutamate-1-semialdehyde 2,1-aminomutase